MTVIGRWASESNRRAIANAREAATECSRRLVERAEVEAFLAETVVTRAARRPSGAAGRSASR